MAWNAARRAVSPPERLAPRGALRSAPLAALAALSWPPSALAGELGVGLAVSSASVRDLDGVAGRRSFVDPLNVRYRWQRTRDGRLRVGLSRLSRRYPPRAGQLALRSRAWRVEVGYARRWRLSSRFKPWLGLSVAHVDESLSARRRFDAEGYALGDALAQRNASGTALGLGASWDLTVFSRWRLGLALGARWPLYRGSRSLGLEALCFFARRADADPFLAASGPAPARGGAR